MIEASALLTALQPFIPITVFVAIGLFLIKEGLEWVKRRRADGRKLAAIKRILARDIEINAWVIKSYRNTLSDVELLDLDSNVRMHFTKGSSGRLRYEHWFEGDDPESIRSGGGYPSPVAANIEKYLLDAATLDRRLLGFMEAAHTALAELEHIRVSTMEQVERPIHREGFVPYAKTELNDIEAELTKLYRFCTGKSKIEARLR